MTEDTVQFFVTRIGKDTFRIVAQDEKRIVATWIVERKNVMERIAREIDGLRVLTTELDDGLLNQAL